MRPLQYPDFADQCHVLRVFPTEVSDEQRLPAHSGATVPDFHRLPVADVTVTLATTFGSPSATPTSRDVEVPGEDRRSDDRHAAPGLRVTRNVRSADSESRATLHP